jgi:hypothetical protein
MSGSRTRTGNERFREITKKGNRPARQIIRANILLCQDRNGTGRPVAEQKVTAKQCGAMCPWYTVSKQYEREGWSGF